MRLACRSNQTHGSAAGIKFPDSPIVSPEKNLLAFLIDRNAVGYSTIPAPLLQTHFWKSSIEEIEIKISGQLITKRWGRWINRFWKLIDLSDAGSVSKQIAP